MVRNGAAVEFLIKKWTSCGISYQEMEQLWYFLLRNGPAVVFLKLRNGAVVQFVPKLKKHPDYKTP